jgi:hypothetical protein
MKGEKHKITLYGLPEGVNIRVFMFQSGDIGNKRGLLEFRSENSSLLIESSYEPEIGASIYVNGNGRKYDFLIGSRVVPESKFNSFKAIVKEYNERT